MTTSISPSQNTSESIFSASNHTTTDNEIANYANMPTTTRRSLKDKAMETIAETFSQFPIDWPLIKINAPKDIKKLKTTMNSLISLPMKTHFSSGASINLKHTMDGSLKLQLQMIMTVRKPRRRYKMMMRKSQAKK